MQKRTIKIEGSKVETNRSFWTDVGEAYRMICYMSDAGDWAAILETIAAQIASARAQRVNTVKILDVGAGLGANSATIAKLLLTRYGILSEWVLVEPDDEARAASRNQFSATPGIPGSALVYSDLSEVTQNQSCDIALLMHSSYEFPEIREALRDLSERLEIKVIIALAIPSDSPFFLVPEQPRVGCSDQIEQVLKEVGYRTRSQRLSSRIRMLPELLDNEIAISNLRMFSRLEYLSNREFSRLIRTRWGREVDFWDSLIVATK